MAEDLPRKEALKQAFLQTLNALTLPPSDHEVAVGCHDLSEQKRKLIREAAERVLEQMREPISADMDSIISRQELLSRLAELDAEGSPGEGTQREDAHLRRLEGEPGDIMRAARLRAKRAELEQLSAQIARTASEAEREEGEVLTLKRRAQVAKHSAEAGGAAFEEEYQAVIEDERTRNQAST